MVPVRLLSLLLRRRTQWAAIYLGPSPGAPPFDASYSVQSVSACLYIGDLDAYDVLRKENLAKRHGGVQGCAVMAAGVDFIVVSKIGEDGYGSAKDTQVLYRASDGTMVKLWLRNAYIVKR